MASIFFVHCSASADNSYLDLDYAGYHKKKNLMIVYYSTKRGRRLGS